MKRFQLIEHTADTGLIAYGTSLTEAFANAAYGLFSIMTDLRKVRAIESREVSVEAEDIESLLFNWMNQLIFLFDTEHILFKRFDITEFTKQKLKAVCQGEIFDPARHEIKIGVKSATYHMLKVDAERSMVQVILDV